MGFLNALKGANNAWGKAITKDGIGTFGPKNLVDNRSHELMIVIFNTEKIFTPADVASVKCLASASEWIKYSLTLKDGFNATLILYTRQSGQKGVDIANGWLNFEWWLYDALKA